jgi:hypothetical protein
MTHEKNSKPLAELCSTFNVIPSVFLYNSWKYAMVMLEGRGFTVYSIASYLYWYLSPVSTRRLGLQARNEECKIAQHFTFMWPCIVTNFLIIKPTRCTNFSNLLWKWNSISDGSSVHHQELFTIHTAMVYVIQVCRQLSSRIRMELQFYPDPDAARKLSTNLYDIYHCRVYSE